MPILASSPSELLNLPMSIRQFPDSWKVAARVAPIYKDGPTDDLITGLFLYCRLLSDSLRS